MKKLATCAACGSPTSELNANIPEIGNIYIKKDTDLTAIVTAITQDGYVSYGLSNGKLSRVRLSNFWLYFCEKTK